MAEGTASSAPASMSAALEQASSAADASAASTPSSSSAPAEPSAPVASEPAAVASTSSVANNAPGPVPYERFTEVNNAKKALEAQVNQLAWAHGLSAEDVRAALTWHQRATTDHAGFLREYIAGAPADRAEAIRSEAARVLAGTRKAEDTEPTPDIEVRDEQGRVTGLTYSDKQLRLRDAWRDRQQEAKFNQRLQPIESRQRQAVEREELQQRLHGIVQFTDHAVKDASTWPHYETYKTEIAEAYKATAPADPRWSDREQGLFEQAQLASAYIKVLGTKGLAPQQATTEAVVADLTKRASAGTESGRAAASTPTRPKSMIAALEAAHAAASGHR